ncbi:MAG: T9SS type A sorting domain-containing protein, partial [Bacteroidetes bacterium]|nr:T9SS type A sorting domain-containing protein [Bacteroidota bacterium]
IPGETRITGQYPNPFRDSATIEYYQAWPGKAQFDVFDVTGRRLGRIETGMQLPGAHKIVWDARGLPGGIYLGRLRVAGKVMVRRLVKI